MHFLQRNQTKLLKDYLELCLRISFFVKMGLSLVLHPTQVQQAVYVSVLDNMLENDASF